MLGVSPNSDSSVFSIPLEDSPSTRQGFGRVLLSASLPLNHSRFNLQVNPQIPGSAILLQAQRANKTGTLCSTPFGTSRTRL